MVNLNKLIAILQHHQVRYGDIPVYIGIDHGSDITQMTAEDYDLVDEKKKGYSNPMPPHLIIGKDCSRK